MKIHYGFLHTKFQSWILNHGYASLCSISPFIPRIFHFEYLLFIPFFSNSLLSIPIFKISTPPFNPVSFHHSLLPNSFTFSLPLPISFPSLLLTLHSQTNKPHTNQLTLHNPSHIRPQLVSPSLPLSSKRGFLLPSVHLRFRNRQHSPPTHQPLLPLLQEMRRREQL